MNRQEGGHWPKQDRTTNKLNVVEYTAYKYIEFLIEKSSKCLGSGKRNMDAFGCSSFKVLKSNLRHNQQSASCAGFKIANVTVLWGLILIMIGKCAIYPH